VDEGQIQGGVLITGLRSEYAFKCSYGTPITAALERVPANQASLEAVTGGQLPINALEGCLRAIPALRRDGSQQTIMQLT
jgi:hypothetical protein